MAKSRETASDLLMPGGAPIGAPGGRKASQQNVREVLGGELAAARLFAALSEIGTPDPPPRYPGHGVNLTDGGWVGFRPVSKSGPPTIDVDIPGLPIKKVKFP